MKKNKQNEWNLDNILEKKDFEKKSREIEKRIEEMEIFWKKINPEMKDNDFERMILENEKLIEEIAKLNYLPHLIMATNQKDQEALAMESKANDLTLKYSQKIRKINHWIKGKKIQGKLVLDDRNAKRLFEKIENLRYVLDYIRKGKKYTLKIKEESIVENKNVNGIEVLKQVRKMMETDFEYELKMKGRKTKILKSQAELLSLIYGSKKIVRKAAYEALLKTYKKNIEKLFLIYQAVVKDWDYESRLRQFESPISVRNFNNDIPDKVVENLLKVVTRNKDIFHRFFKFKAKELKVRKLSRFDIYAPIKTKEKKLELEKVKDKILEVFLNFSPRFFRAAKKIIEEGHIDYYPKTGKIGGAFCATVGPKISPYILLNYTGRMRDVFTMAHELGHGVHSVYAEKNLPSAQKTGLPLAETASTLAEMILFEDIFENEKDKEIKKTMLVEKMADSFASILRQNYFVLFEKEAHQLINQGTTPEKLSDLYLKLLREQFGKSVEIDPIFKYEWAYIPHIVESPFYCYAYSFGELLSFALFSRYKKEGKSFIRNIEKILETGGSKNPMELLEEMGVDISEESFWEESFGLIRDWQDKLENI